MGRFNFQIRLDEEDAGNGLTSFGERNSSDVVRVFTDTHKVSNISYLVDPASGHMLVSKIKPCMSLHKRI